MRILFDNGTPNPIARSLAGHEVAFARRIGWHQLKNGELLRKAEDAGYQLLLTSDKNMRHQQNLAGRKIAIVVLGNQQWPQRSMPQRPAAMRKSKSHTKTDFQRLLPASTR